MIPTIRLKSIHDSSQLLSICQGSSCAIFGDVHFACHKKKRIRIRLDRKLSLCHDFLSKMPAPAQWGDSKSGYLRSHSSTKPFDFTRFFFMNQLSMNQKKSVEALALMAKPAPRTCAMRLRNALVSAAFLGDSEKKLLVGRPFGSKKKH